MKKTLIFLTAIAMPLQFVSAVFQKSVPMETTLSIPDQFLTSPNTKTSEWGCPVNDHIVAGSKAAAVEEIKSVCEKEILKAAQNTPGTKHIISIETIFPDLDIRQTGDGFNMTGTIFFKILASRK